MPTRNGREILVVDDEQASLDAMTLLLEGWGWTVTAATSGAAALRAIEREAPDLVITDLVMPDVDGLEVLRRTRALSPDVPVVVVTGRGGVEEAVRATREGALHFVQKPVDPVLLRATIQGAFESSRARREVTELRRRRVRDGGDAGSFVGESRAMREVLALVERVAPSRASVVVTGESGTGKEMVARAVHQLSGRRDKAFVAINCSAIPASLMESEIFGHERGAFTGADQRRLGCFELADGGTLFLDEVGEIPLELQAKFLRVLEEGRLRRLGGRHEVEVDVRVVAATNRDLRELVRQGSFREDLFFRLNVFHLPLPPLRDRPEDVPALVEQFVRRYAAEAGKEVTGVSPRALRLLRDHRWPGNIRELRNCIERAVLLCDGTQLTEAHLPPEIVAPAGEASLRLPMGMRLRDVARAYIEATLARHGGSRTRTAQALGIGEKTLYNKLLRYAADDARTGPSPEDDDEEGVQAS
jgi:DNA-binding NtrC family response regulator